ncbi:MAG: PKD domain-containing protein [Planctomycetales bacterium]|nr:PKD domain-containing protein [bacterium]UNM09818.1 MAG: PKD domain-containing protein [Planctomycetales bacterium]
MKGRKIAFLPCAIIILLLLGGCGGNAGSGNGSTALNDAAGKDMKLEQQLQAELLGLLADRGIDAQRSASRPPLGESNHVFSSRLTANEPDGAGDDGSLRLLFVPRLAGDYDGNGEVGLSDVTPLAQNFGKSVLYGKPALPGGADNPPVGDPYSDGHANWLLSRCDGDGNGVISSADLTAIALHFGERADGWRVEWRNDDFSGFAPLADPNGLLDGYSLGWQDGRVSNLAQEFILPWPLSGHAEVRLRAWDARTGSGGEASAVQVYDVASTDCVAALQLIENEQPAPFLARFTATGSTVDADSYELDFGDGSSQLIASITEFPVEHLYETGGTSLATLTVNCGQDSAQAGITAVATPVPTAKQAHILAFSNTGFAPQTVHFSYQWTDEPAVSYTLDFGDGSEPIKVEEWATQLPTEHVYTTAGEYTASLTLEARYLGTSVASVPVTILQGTPELNLSIEAEYIDAGNDSIIFDFSGSSPVTAVLSLGDVFAPIEIDLGLVQQYAITSEQIMQLDKDEKATISVEIAGQTYSDSVMIPRKNIVLTPGELDVLLVSMDNTGNILETFPGVGFSLLLSQHASTGSPLVNKYTTGSGGYFMVRTQQDKLSKLINPDGSDPLVLLPDPADRALLEADYIWPEGDISLSPFELVYGGTHYIRLRPRS